MNKAKEFQLVSSYKYGYRNREDKTLLPPSVLITGSQNVLTNTSGRIAVRQGYTLDGQADATIAPVLSSYDWEMHTGDIRHLRAANAKLQYRYVASAGDKYKTNTLTAGQVYWIDLMTGLSSVNFNFTGYWDNTLFVSRLLFVNGASAIYDWTGGVTTIASTTTTTITKTGTTTWAAENFDQQNTIIGDVTTVYTITNTGGNTYRYTYTGVGTSPNLTSSTAPVGTLFTITATGFNVNNRGTFAITAINTNYFEVTNVIGVAEANKTVTGGSISYDGGYSYGISINGNSYTYTSGAATTTITVTSSPVGEANQSVVQQSVITTLNSAMTALPVSLTNDLIGNLGNQIYIGSFLNNDVFVSKKDDYKNYSFTMPTRIVGEGAQVSLRGTPVAFAPQENKMYIAAGIDHWYETEFVLSSDLVSEAFNIIPLKTAPQQAAMSQAMVSNDKNKVIFVSNEPVLTTLGRVSGVIGTPQSEDISYPIINDFNDYDFTNGSVFYFKNFLYVAVPQEGLIRVYNQTDANNHYWEAPLTIPVSRFSIIDGELYGHSYQTPETFKLFTGYNDNGAPIEAKAVFSFNNYGTRFATKSFNQFYYEGYISSNTTLNLGIQYELDGCAQTQSFPMEGTERFVCTNKTDASLGKVSLGKNPLGGTLQTISSLPPKFRKIKTFPRVPFYEESTTFSSNGIDQQWEIVAFGPAAEITTEGNNYITD